jgi:hypothetical protein
MQDSKFPVPVMTAETFSHQTGLPLGVVKAQMSRRLLPVLRVGKRSLVNLEALRITALEAAIGAAR